MNAITLTFTTMTLGVMIGITGTHYRHVNTLVDRGVATPVQQPVQVNEPVYQEIAPVQAPVLLSGSDVLAPPRPVVPMIVENGDEHNAAILELLTALRSEQQTMRKQMADTNRDFDELSFRVDTHSDSFKPLRTDIERVRPLGDAVDLPLDGGSDLLPPKQ